MEVAQEETIAAPVAVEVESEVTAVARPRRTERPVAEVKAAVETARVAITSDEHNIALKMENDFLRTTGQILQLQKQAESIQKNFPEYIKKLAAKYSIDLTKNTFDLISGVFNKNQ